MQVILCPTLEIAREQYEKFNGRVATVECEYGDEVVEGAITLAHHVEKYKGCPAPCIQYISDDDRKLFDTILISHLDLDTLGGVLALIDEKPYGPSFWNLAALVDVAGPHQIHTSNGSFKTVEQIQAFWAWAYDCDKRERATQATDVTHDVMIRASVLQLIFLDSKHYLNRGKEWAANLEAEIESKLEGEDEHVRAFTTDRVFCNGSYWSPKQNKVIPAIVSFNKAMQTVTVSFESPEADGLLNAKNLVQLLWGPEAGGHAGIAGSPRGRKMTSEDAGRAVKAVKELFLEYVFE